MFQWKIGGALAASLLGGMMVIGCGPTDPADDDATDETATPDDASPTPSGNEPEIFADAICESNVWTIAVSTNEIALDDPILFTMYDDGDKPYYDTHDLYSEDHTLEDPIYEEDSSQPYYEDWERELLYDTSGAQTMNVTTFLPCTDAPNDDNLTTIIFTATDYDTGESYDFGIGKHVAEYCPDCEELDTGTIF